MAYQPAYIQMFSVHGLIRGKNLELGCNADTGGQINYVLEIAKELSKREDVSRIDIFTRLISDKAYSADYAVPEEQINKKLRIVRIQCKGRKYIRKELLWPHLDEFVDNTIKYIKKENAIPDVMHGHYPDAGYVSMQLSKIFGVPFVYTGHSLGRVKKSKLIDDGMNEEEINKRYKIDRRIYAEEDILKNADLVITSTHEEVDRQYGMYRNRHMPTYKVIPPGIDVDKFYPFYHDRLPDNEKTEMVMYAHAKLLTELNRFFVHPEKPIILALSRPDKRKNISGLIKAYGESLELQSMANLAIFAGIRKDIETMEDNEKNVLTKMLLLMDKYDLYGKMAIPKKHDFELEVPALYRIVAEKRGAFINPALTEPFGLTLLEASATGVPIVATNDGGPQDILHNCKSGYLINPNDSKEMVSALKKIVSDGTLWEQFSKNGIMNVRKHYTWKRHAEVYAKQVNKLVKEITATNMQAAVPKDPIGKRLARLNYFLFTDIDHTLLGEDNSKLPAFVQFVKSNKNRIGFGVASGRTIESIKEVLESYHIPSPDIIVSSVGSEIYYGKRLHYGQGWASHISNKWQRDRIVDLLKAFDFLEYQEEETQRPFKISYFMPPEKDYLTQIHSTLLTNKCRYNLIYSHDQFLDILPYRASKGKALRYLSYKWEIPLRNFLVCGDSGNDEEMLRGEPLAVVVGNYSTDLEHLRDTRNVFFAKAFCAGGILEGVEHYRFDEVN